MGALYSGLAESFLNSVELLRKVAEGAGRTYEGAIELFEWCMAGQVDPLALRGHIRLGSSGRFDSPTISPITASVTAQPALGEGTGGHGTVHIQRSTRHINQRLY